MDYRPAFFAVVSGNVGDSERAVLKTEFSKFGRVQKLYIYRNQKCAKVYFDNEQSVKEACKHLNGIRNWKVEYFKDTYNKYDRNKFGRKSDDDLEDSYSGCSQSCSDNMEEGFYLTDTYVDSHGRPVEVLEGENGKLYVSLDDVRRAGFGIFNAESYENAIISREDDLKEFTNYMLNQGMKYALKFKKAFSEQEICSTFEKVRETLERGPHRAVNNTFRTERVINKDVKSNNFVITKISTVEAGQSISQESDVNGFQKHSRSFGRMNEGRDNWKNRSKDKKTVTETDSFIQTNNNSSQVQEKVWNSSMKTAPLEPLHLAPGGIYKVKVSFANPDKKSVFFGHLVGNEGLLDNITKQVNSVDRMNREIKNPKEHTACVAYHDDSWFRAHILRVNGRQITVTLVDFGNKVNVNVPVRYLSDTSRWPVQAIRMTLSNKDIHTVTPGEELEVEIKKLYDDTNLVTIKNVLNVQYVEENKPKKTEDTIQGNKSDKEEFDEPVFFKIPPISAELKPEELVMILGFSDSHLTLRNKECADTSRNIYSYIHSFKGLPIKEPKVGQVVLCGKDGIEGLHRAVIRKINGIDAEVEYIDYCGSEVVLLKSLRNVDEEIVSKASAKVLSPTYPTLKKMTENSVHFLIDLILSKKKLKVVLQDSQFDLIYTDGETSTPLSLKIEELENVLKVAPSSSSETTNPTELEVKSPVKQEVTSRESDKPVSLSDMDYVKPEKGVGLYLCYNCIGRRITILLTSEEHVEYMARLDIKDVEDDEPIVPEIEQMCLAKQEDLWYRAAVLERKDDPDTFQVLFVDYGNIETVGKNSLRKFPVELASIPVLGISTYFMDIPDDQKVYDRLMELLPNDTIIEIDVKTDINEDFEYGIEVPSVYKQLREEKLI